MDTVAEKRQNCDNLLKKLMTEQRIFFNQKYGPAVPDDLGVIPCTDCISPVIGLIREKRLRRLMVVHGRRSYQGKARLYIDGILDGLQCESQDFSDFKDNPQRSDAEKGAFLANAFRPQMIIAIGGGSVIDMAKLVRHFSSAYGTILAAVPTTAGTGAESTPFAVCYEGGRKTSVGSQGMLPDLAILEPAFTFCNDRYLTACTAFDAMAQAIEAYWNRNATDVSDNLALMALKLVFGPLKRVMAGSGMSTETDRGSLMLGASFAGRAIAITRTTLPHALSYVLTSKYHYPHGHAVALTFPYLFERNACSLSEQKREKLLGMLGFDGAVSLCEQMRNFTVGIGLGFDRGRDFADSDIIEGVNLQRAQNNPLAPTRQLIAEAVGSIRKNV